MKGIIALDMDGTVTCDPTSIPSCVRSYLKELHCEGWTIAFVTGRSFPFANFPLQKVEFPFYLAVHNGASIYYMPSRKIVCKRHLGFDLISKLESMIDLLDTDLLVYSGEGDGDICYYRPNKLPPDMLGYLIELTKLRGSEIWFSVDSFDILKDKVFSTFKWYGTEDVVSKFADSVRQKFNLNAPVIKDPYNQKYHIAVATDSSVDKGMAVKDIASFANLLDFPIICAGDDYNDKPMFDVATTSIVMSTAPQNLIEKADICAAPAKEEGIIDALEKAVQ